MGQHTRYLGALADEGATPPSITNLKALADAGAGFGVLRSSVAFGMLGERMPADEHTREVLAKAVPGSGAPDTVELPPELTWHDYAVFLLHVGAEIEHALMVQYLYAAWSMGGPQVPAARRTKVREWQSVILGIAREEMGHFITVQNLLRLITHCCGQTASNYRVTNMVE